MTRFYETPPWRFVVCDAVQPAHTGNDGAIVTFLDRHAAGRAVTFTLNKTAQAVGTVASDDPEINIILPPPDGEPFLSNSNRLLYGFRREKVDAGVWICRYAGIVMPIQDQATSDQPFTTYTAYDPWQLLYTRPLLRADGSLPGQNGIRYTNTPGSDIAYDLLVNTVVANGSARIDYGQTGFYAGTLTPTDPITIVFQQGISVGEAWDQLVDVGNLDIVLLPIYDPHNRPGYLCELNIAPEWGSPKYDAVFAWDKPSRSLVGVEHGRDGSQLVNVFQPYIGQGGPAAAQQSSAPSIARYGEYWEQQSYPDKTVKTVVEAAGLAQIAIRSRGKDTIQISPAPERSPVPFEEYFLGDQVPVYASNRLRQPISLLQRVYSIPLQISDDQLEHVDSLLITPEENG